jgi:hypothetical protein
MKYQQKLPVFTNHARTAKDTCPKVERQEFEFLGITIQVYQVSTL